ncbi:zinc-ribbon domain-containing protein [uncultured Mitsuokella sp.]|uniref:zinc-ribbon domain-containing protein n=1 Tax=uncultured Mitsuokella sp. TaxID=453120 RepID=UPI002591BB0D|nr:zinc ribbon domain-containing protein [uncultured Mitsuokella sp.]
MARFCPNCGQPVTENEKFCHQCGSTLQTSVDSQPADRLRANTPVPNADNISIVDICKNPKAILLKSAAPLPRKAAWIKWGYIISLIAAVVNLGVGFFIFAPLFIMQQFTAFET